ncbi:hypothetical protein Ddye_011852 [Dipteronia dyeriana]|uniref:Pentatricopeptide repeat-containing protein n=1 Tax=Dipteronia dyeriana TaxID=168575 RepID=A0AAD9X399_9ROSI|nr:hypothetical protein Ddye_011852 [Dipteronia dyeriana]
MISISNIASLASNILSRFNGYFFTSMLPRLPGFNHLKSHFHTCSSVLHSSCTNLKTLKQIHASRIIQSGFVPIYVSSHLIFLYSHFNDLDSALSVFNTLYEPPPNTQSWYLILKSHVGFCHFDKALILYKKMREPGVEHDTFTFPIINRVLYSEMVHCVAMKMGFALEIVLCNTMIEFYVKCGCFNYAYKVFDEMLERDLVTWTSMISGYVSEEMLAKRFHCSIK